MNMIQFLHFLDNKAIIIKDEILVKELLNDLPPVIINETKLKEYNNE